MLRTPQEGKTYSPTSKGTQLLMLQHVQDTLQPRDSFDAVMVT